MKRLAEVGEGFAGALAGFGVVFFARGQGEGGFEGLAGEVALAAWRVLRCRDGGRADVRLDAAGQPRFIEVNPLAGIRPGYSDLCFIADFVGLDYQGLIGKFMASFLARHPELR